MTSKINENNMTEAEKREADEAISDALALERKQDLAVIQLMLDTPILERPIKAEEIGLPWDEYLHLTSKYREVIKRYEENLNDSKS